MDDQEIRAALVRVEETLDALDRLPPVTASRCRDALAALVSLYGEGLTRIVAVVERDAPAVTAALAGDDLVAHLLLLHDLHPDGIAARVERALDDLRAHGTDVTLVGVRDGVARVRAATRCGGCARSDVEAVILDAAPELSRIELTDEVLIPLDALTTRAAR